MAIVSDDPVSKRQRQLVPPPVDQILLRVETAVHQPIILDSRIKSMFVISCQVLPFL